MADAVNISWCPQGLGIQGDGNNITFIPTSDDEESSQLPSIPDWVDTVHCIYLPLEETLTRHIQLPLKSTKHLDADMLLQELSDNAGIEPNDWWLTWCMKSTDNGIAGLVFGIKKSLQTHIQDTAVWQNTPLLLVDGWQRLHVWLGEDSDAGMGIIDCDAEGIFLGFYQDGIWQGMRRLNGNIDKNAAQVLWSLQAMGFDEQTMPVSGRFSAEIATHFPQQSENMQINSDFPNRHIANLSLTTPATNDKQALNIRHGKWASKQTSAAIKAWYRPILLAGLIGFLWLGSMVASNMQLEAQLETMQDDITAAFHRGLPEQPVIIDALAQLRQAAGGNTGSSSQDVSQQLYALSQTFMKTPWEMQDFSMGKRGISLAGKVKDLDTLNQIRNDLSTKLGRDVQIADTDLKGNQVTFRMRW